MLVTDDDDDDGDDSELVGHGLCINSVMLTG